MGPNHYQAMGVSQNADATQIKQAYRKLAQKLHPDVNPSPEAAEKFKAINHAYSVLSDPKQRAAHDATLKTAPSKPAPGPGKPQGAPAAPNNSAPVKYTGTTNSGPSKPSAGGPSRPSAPRQRLNSGAKPAFTPTAPTPTGGAPVAGKPTKPTKPGKPKLGGTKLGAMHTQMFAPQGQGGFVKSNAQFGGEKTFTLDSAFERFNRNRPDIYKEYRDNPGRHEEPYQSFEKLRDAAKKDKAAKKAAKKAQLGALANDRSSRTKSERKNTAAAQTAEAQRNQGNRGERLLNDERATRTNNARRPKKAK